MNLGTEERREAYVYLRDELAATDAFGPHQRTAAAIARAIIANPALRFIGLLGPWGSGKSTVVGFVADELKKTKETHVFTFDAWLHQADPPRRSFLESFVNFLVSRGLTDKSKWSERVDQLNGRIQDTTITKTPQLTMAGRMILVALLGVPVGWSLVLKSSVIDAVHPEVHTGIVLAAGVTLVALPLLIALIVYLTWRPTWKMFDAVFWSKKNWTTHKGDRAKEAIFSLFLSRQTQTTKDRITKDPEPTSIEFQRTFRELMASVVDLRRRFLIVIDNLDRLPEAEAIALWSTIRGFFLGSELSGHAVDKSLLPTVILPIDMTAIRLLYDNDEDEADRASAFIEKTFDVTFQVNRPVFTGWRGYLESQMKVLFKEELEDRWVYITSRILDRAAVAFPKNPITPRRINALINRIANQWMLRPDTEVSFAAVVYYCVFQNEIEANIVNALLNQRLTMEVYDAQWKRGVAAVHFGVPSDVANSVLLDVPIRNAIDLNDRDRFHALSTTAGFAEELVRVCESRNYDNTDASTILRTAVMLGISSPDSSPALSEAWKQLREALPRTGAWSEFSDDDHAGLQFLLRDGTPQENLTILMTASRRAFEGPQGSSVTIAARVAQLWTHAHLNHGDAVALAPSIRIDTTPASYLAFVGECVDMPEILERVASSLPNDQLASHIAAEFPDSDGPAADNRLRGALRSAYKPDLNALADLVVNSLDNGAGEGLARALLAAGLMRGNSAVDTGIRRMIDSGRLAAVLLEFIRLKDVRLAARPLAILLSRRPDAIPNPTQPWLQVVASMPELAAAVDDALAELADSSTVTFTRLAQVAGQDPNIQPFVEKVLGHRLDCGKALFIDAGDFLELQTTFSEALSEADFTRVLRLLASDDVFWSALQSSQFLAHVWPLVHALADLGGEITDRTLTVLHHHLLSALEDDWIRATAVADAYSDAAAFYMTHRGSPSIPTLADPLRRALGPLFEQSTSATWLHWFNLSRALDTGARRVLLRSIRDRLAHAPPASPEAVLSAGGEGLLDEGDFVARADELCRNLLPLLVETTAGVAYLTAYAPLITEWVKAANVDSRNALIGQIARIGEDGGGSDGLSSLHTLWSVALRGPDTP